MKLNAGQLMKILAEKGLSLRDLACLCGWAPSMISAIKARGSCNAKTAHTISQALEIEVEEIFDLT